MSEAGNAARIGVRVYAETGEFHSSMGGVVTRLKGFNASASSATGAVSRLGAQLAAAAVAALSLNKAIQAADSWTRFNNKLKVVTDTMGTFEATSRRVYDVAQSAAVPLDDVSAAYTRLQGAASRTGASQAEVLKVTEGLIKAFKASGATGKEAAETVRQLGQGLGAGALNGDELRSVLEGSIPVADAIARAFGTTRDKLKKMGEEGQLVTSTLFPGLVRESQKFIDDFAKTDRTFADGMTRMGNAATRLIGEFNEWSQSSSKVGEFVNKLVDGVDGLSDRVESGALGKMVALLGTQFKTSFGDAASAAKSLLDLALFPITYSLTKISDWFTNNWMKIIPAISAGVQSAAVSIGSFFDTVEAKMRAWGASGAITQGLMSQASKDASTQFVAAEAARKQAAEESQDAIWRAYDAQVKGAESAIAAVKDEQKAFEEKQRLEEKALERKGAAAAETMTVDFNAQSVASDSAQLLAQQEQARAEAFQREIDQTLDKNMKLQEADEVRYNSLSSYVRSKYAAALEEEEIFQESLAALKEMYLTGELESRDAYYKAQQEAEMEHIRAMYDINARQAASMESLTARSFGARAGAAVGFFKDAAALLSGESKKAFEISKKFALADAAISMYQGIAAGLRLGWPLAIPAVAFATAKGVSAIQSIRSQSYGGGTSGSTGAGGGGGGGASGGGGGAGAAPAQEIIKSVRVEGLSQGALFGGGQVKGLLKSVEDYIGDGGGRILFA